MLIGARFVQGIGGALASAVILGMIVTMFPEPARAGESDRRLRLRRLRRRLDRAAARRRPHRGDQLALDLHHQPADRHPRRLPRPAPGRRTATGIGLHEGADFPGAALITVSLMLGVFTILQITEWGWVDPTTLALSAVSAALLGAFIRRQATIANPLMPLRLFRSRNVAGANVAAGAAGRRDVRDVLPRRPLPAAGAPLQRPRGRPRLPADDDRDGRRSRSASRKN